MLLSARSPFSSPKLRRFVKGARPEEREMIRRNGRSGTTTGASSGKRNEIIATYDISSNIRSRSSLFCETTLAERQGEERHAPFSHARCKGNTLKFTPESGVTISRAGRAHRSRLFSQPTAFSRAASIYSSFLSLCPPPPSPSLSLCFSSLPSFARGIVACDDSRHEGSAFSVQLFAS